MLACYFRFAYRFQKPGLAQPLAKMVSVYPRQKADFLAADCDHHAVSIVVTTSTSQERCTLEFAAARELIDGGAMSGLSHDRKAVIIVAQQHTPAAGRQ
jgi:hypothetical protein